MNIVEEVPEFYQRYVKLAHERDTSLLALLSETEMEWQQLLQNVSDEKAEKAYLEGKWTLKELLQHVIDTERIMSYRALCIARGEKLSLPGYDHDNYVSQSEANNRSMLNLLEEAAVVRSSSIHLIKSFSEEILTRKGTFNGHQEPVSVRGIGYIIVGHQLHHQNIIKENYL